MSSVGARRCDQNGQGMTKWKSKHKDCCVHIQNIGA